MISVRPLLFRAMYPRRHTGKTVGGTCGALPRQGRFSAIQDRESSSLNSEFFSPDGAIAGPTALFNQIRTWRRQPWPNKE
jgi:hypothetical protein